LETIVKTYTGPRTSEEWDHFLVYVKRVWFSNGIHHHYATLKFEPGFSEDYFVELVQNSDADSFPLLENESIGGLIKLVTPIIFDPEVDPKKINLDPDADQVLDSATNFYAPDLTEEEVEAFYSAKIDNEDPRPISYGLNSQLVKVDGDVQERVWKIDGMYGEAIEKIVFWLSKAVEVAENDKQRAALEKLIEYYKTGDLRTFDEYSILWV
jgi:dipeptidyl-peptidase-3